MASTHQSEAKGKLIPLPLRKVLHSEPSRIAISLQNTIEVLHFKEMIVLKANGNYTEIYLISGEKIMVCNTLKKFEKKLSNNQFLRIHSGYIINQTYLKSFCLKTQTVRLTNQMQIPVSRSKRSIINQFLNQISL
jgi:two-component system LytT family response regulator